MPRASSDEGSTEGTARARSTLLARMTHGTMRIRVYISSARGPIRGLNSPAIARFLPTRCARGCAPCEQVCPRDSAAATR